MTARKLAPYTSSSYSAAAPATENNQLVSTAPRIGPAIEPAPPMITIARYSSEVVAPPISGAITLV